MSKTKTKQIVYTLTIDHRHGKDTTVYATEESARRALAEYCREYWKEWANDDEVMPTDEDTLIEKYFEMTQESIGREEYSSIEHCEVNP